MELEFIDVSQRGEEKRTSRNRNYVRGSVVHADRPARRENPPRRRRTPEEIERRRQMILQKRKRQRKRRIIKGIILLCETAFIVLLCLLLYQLIRSFRVSSKDTEIVTPEAKEVVKMIEENKSQNR